MLLNCRVNFWVSQLFSNLDKAASWIPNVASCFRIAFEYHCQPSVTRKRCRELMSGCTRSASLYNSFPVNANVPVSWLPRNGRHWCISWFTSWPKRLVSGSLLTLHKLASRKRLCNCVSAQYILTLKLEWSISYYARGSATLQAL